MNTSNSKMTNVLEKQEYLYNFIGGGWNSEYAYNVEEAIHQAKISLGKSSTLKVDETSFRLITKNDYNTCMNSFN